MIRLAGKNEPNDREKGEGRKRNRCVSGLRLCIHAGSEPNNHEMSDTELMENAVLIRSEGSGFRQHLSVILQKIRLAIQSEEAGLHDSCVGI